MHCIAFSHNLDPERTYEQSESGPSTELRREARLRTQQIHRDERSEDPCFS